MPADELPKPGMPKVDYIEPSLQRWTFASDDPEVQEREFWRWLGWFALEEADRPHSKEGRVWLVRRANR